MRPLSGLISRWASYGYDRDSWQESLLDFVGFVSDPADPNTPLPEAGMACIIGKNPTGSLSGYEYGDVLFHSTDPDEFFVKKPSEVRVLLDRSTGSIWMWDFYASYWFKVGSLTHTELVEDYILLTQQVLDDRIIHLSRPVLDMPPLVHLTGCGMLVIDTNFWMPDNETITFDDTSGPDALINFPLIADQDMLKLRYHSLSNTQIGG